MNSTDNFQFFREKTRTVRAWFYLVTPDETTPDDSMASEYGIYDFVEMSVPIFLALVFLELFLSPFTGKRVRVNDVLTSVTAASYFRIPELFGISAISMFYWPAYEHRIFSIPYWSTWHWIAGAFAADFGYYWAHRLVHEFNIAWTSHQVHHSSEDYNLSTALRQSILQQFFTFLCFIPAGFLGVHPSMFYTHLSMNLTWQFWIHTETIRYMGAPFEFIFNTPSHHRVHHGRNPFCIDKNYAGVLIIWDRMFGTFESEFYHADGSPRTEEVKYGLVRNIRTFDPTTVQFAYLKYVLTKAKETPGFLAKLKVLLMGPGYNPKQPQFRLGNPDHLPKINPKYEIFNPEASWWMKVYAFIVGTHSNILFEFVFKLKSSFGLYEKLIVASYFIYSGSAAAALFSNQKFGYFCEIIRFFVIFPFLMKNNSFGPYFVENFNLYASLSLSIGILFSIKYFQPQGQKLKKL